MFTASVSYLTPLLPIFPTSYPKSNSCPLLSKVDIISYSWFLIDWVTLLMFWNKNSSLCCWSSSNSSLVFTFVNCLSYSLTRSNVFLILNADILLTDRPMLFLEIIGSSMFTFLVTNSLSSLTESNLNDKMSPGSMTNFFWLIWKAFISKVSLFLSETKFNASSLLIGPQNDNIFSSKSNPQ